MARYDLPDETWALIQPLLLAEPATPRSGRPWAEHRMIINVMFWMLCSGAPWYDLPGRYGPWKTVYNRFNRWSESGVINIIFNRLLTLLDANSLIDWSATALDGIQELTDVVSIAQQQRAEAELKQLQNDLAEVVKLHFADLMNLLKDQDKVMDVFAPQIKEFWSTKRKIYRACVAVKYNWKSLTRN